MPDLLLELRSEEIPARMQRRAAEDLKKRVTDALVERGFLYEGARAFSTPRRLALHVAGLPARGDAVREERRGPRVGAPEAAVQGFLKGAGLTSLDQARTVADPKKGEFYLAVIERPGRETLDVLAEILPEIIKNFPWPKAMRWGAASAQPGSLRWVRPLQSIVATFGPETEATEVVPFAVGGVTSGAVTYGHRFLAPGPIEVRRFDDYVRALERAKVILDADRRKDVILHDARDLAFARNLDLVEDEGLLEEVAGLVEWPVVLMGAFDEAFLDIPAEAVRATIRANQKCFVLRKASTEELAPAFVLVSNLEATDGGLAITAGNERVVRARLSDAKFFWDTDRAVPLEDRLPKLDGIVFHEKLGTQGQRVARIAALARELAPLVGADPDLAERAARLAKADLVTEMVGEFPELQGLMGGKYAALQGEHPSVCAAIADHYRPLGPSDRVPTDPVAVAVALADKLDTLVGFWAIDEKPTGSKDPYALRRAALGVIRIILEENVRFSISKTLKEYLIKSLVKEYPHVEEIYRSLGGREYGAGDIFVSDINRIVAIPYTSAILQATDADGAIDSYIKLSKIGAVTLPEHIIYRNYINNFFKIRDFIEYNHPSARALTESNFLVGDAEDMAVVWGDATKLFNSAANAWLSDLLTFFADRLKTYLRDQGARHDLVDAVFALPGQDDLLLIVRRVEALQKFLDTEDGKNLLAGTKRAANILRIEEKRDGRAFDAEPDAARAAAGEPAERALAEALGRARAEASAAVAREDFSGAMRALSTLRAPVDAFFQDVTVNAPDPGLRENRLLLLNALRAATREVADFSRIEG